MNPIERIHGGYVFNRRVRVLAAHLSEVLPKDASALDVGCGDGTLIKAVCERRSDISAEGIDVLVRDETAVPVKPFDGRTIPHADDSFDVVMFVDVLHHTEDPMVLLREARRVARRAIVLKDHTRDGLFAGSTLRFMDWVGNARHGVALPYNYWPELRWRSAFGELGLGVAEWRSRLALYPPPAGWFFDRSLHFIARLEFSERGCVGDQPQQLGRQPRPDQVSNASGSEVAAAGPEDGTQPRSVGRVGGEE